MSFSIHLYYFGLVLRSKKENFCHKDEMILWDNNIRCTARRYLISWLNIFIQTNKTANKAPLDCQLEEGQDVSY